jgi:FixJ family two-component response regulator
VSETSIVSIVDDDQSVGVSLGALVRSLGYHARVFPSAESFLNSAELQWTRCLVADIQMPGMTGIELQQALIAQGRKFPIIFITAYPQDSTRQQVLADGAVCLLSKPYDGEVLAGHIERAMSSHG